MKQITLFEGVDFGGYGDVRPICADDCVELLDAVVNSDTGQALAVVSDGKNMAAYVISVSKTPIRLYVKGE
jgi:hypothetical protein